MWTRMIACALTVGGLASSTSFAPAAAGRFSVDGTVVTTSTAVVTAEPRAAAPGYTWVRAYFYTAPLPAADGPRAAQGRIARLSTRWAAALQLTVDSQSRITQVDLSLPGHTCTVAESTSEIHDAVQAFRFDGRQIHLAAHGTHVCDLRSLGIPNQTFAWDVTLDAPVVASAQR